MRRQYSGSPDKATAPLPVPLVYPCSKISRDGGEQPEGEENLFKKTLPLPGRRGVFSLLPAAAQGFEQREGVGFAQELGVDVALLGVVE